MDFSFWFLAAKNLFEQGGFVMPPLLFCAAALWYGLGYRYCILKTHNSLGMRDLYIAYNKSPNQPAKDLIEHAMQQAIAIKKQKVPNLRRHLDAAFYEYELEIRQYSVLIKVIVMIAPLLGLLGTVSGMIETFDSLAAMALFTQSGGIAGGVAQALLTTQTGLSVAIPGVLVQSILQKKQMNIQNNLAQIKDLLCSQQPNETL
ncbi:MotA/TolQ/ExbB proton channel family protein [methanotrophic endosymbiont of Bathymodiolus puteoserpentis (Logatchev)]|jgi:biopolymer transport protein ExbB|uniref:MotA/TolQ/ExbB proton channel family protein n=1 Tax=methanotrophic endosymbiont of Bathymodiolus puteoserpentis (Logatchev) TaxID=343235 RepID=UPI0013CC8D1C|nr:MotA/TolQ/ExbB proton channel family protein [methanotrophic endosymbiont of Bathymodiolus puteoserpentis (Logatchev)]SHE19699.1 MotA/TolQ/ExbB proton channel family protein [methanotrophic endosymbiont of Bathymodiolus puteoserpentis (Logatchev)]